MNPIKVSAADIQTGDKIRRVSRNGNFQKGVVYEVVSVTPGHHPKNPKMVGVNIKMRDRHTKRCKNEFQYADSVHEVYRQA